MALQAAEKLDSGWPCNRAWLYRLRKNSIQDGFVTGHGFSRADKANQMSWALQAAEKLDSGWLCNRAWLQPCR
jgi:hypothetical protein